MASRIPPLLQPYLCLPPETSLILLTGILGSTTNWLVQRHLYSLLSPLSIVAPTDEGSGLADASSGDVNVVFVSFLRDYTFWKEGLRRLGVDLDASTRKGRFEYVDGLESLFQPLPHAHGSKPAASSTLGRRGLSTPTVDGLRKELEDAISQLKARSTDSRPRTVLIIDQLDLLLAAVGNGLSSQALHEMLLDVRETVYSTIITLSADEPLISPQTTLVEREHAAFILSIAHDAHLITSLRMLDTGTAKDVSGVLRVTRGGQYDEDPENIIDERELLYFVGGDGYVRVFERGQ